MHITALIPMKEHSERVPNKNIRAFGDEPLFYAIMKKLLKNPRIDQIIINTDSAEISRLAQSLSNKIIIHERPEELRGDFVSMNKIIDYDLKNSKSTHYLQAHSTNPLVREATIKKAIDTYLEKIKAGYDSLFSVTKYQTRLYDAEGYPVNHNPKELIRTQDLPALFEENSCFYIFSKDSFKAAGNKRIGLRPFMYEISKLEAVDIDTEDDFIIAETIFKIMEQKHA